jgi:hypothetical protein
MDIMIGTFLRKTSQGMLLGLVLAALTLLWQLNTYAASRSVISSLNATQSHEVFLPSQLYAGTPNTLTVRGGPASEIVVLLSSKPIPALPSAEGALPEAPVRLLTTLPSSGSASMEFQLPEDPSLVGMQLFVAAFYRASASGSFQSASIRDASGVITASPSLLVQIPSASKSGVMLMPAVPGVDPSLMRQMGTISEMAQTKDPRRKSLIYDGTINRDLIQDRNSLVVPGGGMPLGR